MIGLGLRREMVDWDLSTLDVDFWEVAPENWLRRDRQLLHAQRAAGRWIQLHGVSLNLGGTSEFNLGFLREVRALMDELEVEHYSDHLAASGDAHQLYDLFPIPFTMAEVRRVSDRIAQVQEVLGRRIAVENTTFYTNVGEMSEPEFLMAVAQRADCKVLLDLNNVEVNHKNHGACALRDFVAQVDPARVSYLHVAGHEYDERFGLYIDTHSQPVADDTAAMARDLSAQHGWPVLLEWDHDIPDPARLQEELACLQPFMTT
jgi:uncharacterized protein (UPF0276 family)